MDKTNNGEEPTWLEIAALGALLGTVAVAGYVGGNYLTSYLQGDPSLPPKCAYSCQVWPYAFPAHSCNASARGLFHLLTGMDAYVIDQLRLGNGENLIYDTVSASERVRMLAYRWDDGSSGTSPDCHFLVHYKGYVYQSYRRTRYNLWGWWSSSMYDGYPLVRMPLTKEMDDIFRDSPENLSVAQFNQWCAPAEHPLASDVKMALQLRLEAKVDPSRPEFRMNLGWFSQ